MTTTAVMPASRRLAITIMNEEFRKNEELRKDGRNTPIFYAVTTKGELATAYNLFPGVHNSTNFEFRIERLKELVRKISEFAFRAHLFEEVNKGPLYPQHPELSKRTITKFCKEVVELIRLNTKIVTTVPKNAESLKLERDFYRRVLMLSNDLDIESGTFVK